MTYFHFEQDRINLETIAGYGEAGPQGIRIFFNSGETNNYGFTSTEERNRVLDNLDKKVGLSPDKEYEAL